jgi:hypothetical protein
MKTKLVLRIALLAVLAVVVFVWYQRGATNPFATRQLGADAANLETAYKTEYSWAIRETAADISEMAGKGSSRSDAPALVETMVPWHPDLLASYAASQIGPAGDAKPGENDPGDQHNTLLPMSVDAILKSNTAVSAALKRDMKNPRAHEAAALTLAAFAMREAAEGLSDTRWALNRMTAHLAMAQALRNGEPASVDGQLAAAALLALTDRQKTAMAALDAFPASTPEAAAWQRALRMRVTQDWKLLAEPANATRLEKLEYFRARRATLCCILASQDLEDIREPIVADFGRIAASRSLTVQDGNNFVDDGLANEIGELAYVYRQIHQRELPKELPAGIVNVRAGRLLADGDPKVIPWGAWAEFGNRHIGMWAVKIDQHYRMMLGAADSADHYKRALDAQLGHLTMYPVASTGRTKGQTGSEADLSQIDKAIDVAIRAPELITYDYWNFMAKGSNSEPVKRGMPQQKTWFALASPDVPYDIALRAEFTLNGLKPPALEALMDEARHNIGLLSRVAQRHKTNEQLMAKVRELTGPHVAYDMWSIDSAINAARDADDRVALRRQACELSVNQCLELASELAKTDEDAAAAEYQKAFSNPALDAIRMTNSSGWLVRYYERNKQPAKALDLAERSASVGSGSGLLTLALLHERRSEFDEADQLYTRNADRYQHKAPLAGFLYRQGVVEKKPMYLVRWRDLERELFGFSGGLQPMATEMKTQPMNGVFVEQDSYWSRQAGLRAGDIIVGVDGWKVENVDQLNSVLWLQPAAKTYKFTAWRGVLFTAEVYQSHGMTLKTHPLKGWIE